MPEFKYGDRVRLIRAWSWGMPVGATGTYLGHDENGWVVHIEWDTTAPPGMGGNYGAAQLELIDVPSMDDTRPYLNAVTE